MGGAASIFRRKRSKNAEGDMEKNGVSNKTVKAPAADKARRMYVFSLLFSTDVRRRNERCTVSLACTHSG